MKEYRIGEGAMDTYFGKEKRLQVIYAEKQ